MDRRRTCLESLVSFDQPIERIRASLGEFPWDFETTLVFLTRDHAANVLRRYLDGTLSAGEVEEWANLLEGRDDIDFESGAEHLRDIIHELANPLLTQCLTVARGNALLNQLRTASN